jgi:hypothetical protein
MFTARQEGRDAMHYRFTFGKYHGKLVADVPEGYLIWCLNECSSLSPRLRRAIQEELDRRQPAEWADDDMAEERHREVLLALARRWHREMSLRFHPDRGGSQEAMQAANAGYERLVEMIEESAGVMS